LVEIYGTFAPGFEHVRDTFARNFEESHAWEAPDLGACVSATIDGETVFDLWGGYTDVEASIPWASDTIVCVFSVTKAIAALCLHLMHDRGLLDIDAPIAGIWPDFAQAGKGGITTRMVLSHTAGLLRADVSEGSLYQDGALVSAIERMAPEWPPGTRAGYHSFTQGPILQEIARRVTGRSLGTWLHEELAGPLLADFAVGLSDKEIARCADVIVDERNGTIAPFRSDPTSAVYKDWAALPRDESFNSPKWRRKEFFSLGGHGNARGIARLLAPLATGGMVSGKRLFSGPTVSSAISEHYFGHDAFAESDARYAAGFQMSDAAYPFSGAREAVGFHGIGGSLGFADPTRRLSFAYCCNRLIKGGAGTNPLSRNLVRELLGPVRVDISEGTLPKKRR
jgi:CubicO group peptidase (beta-lactamase class C family)